MMSEKSISRPGGRRAARGGRERGPAAEGGKGKEVQNDASKKEKVDLTNVK